MPPQIIPSNEELQQVACDALVIGAFEEDGGAALDDSGRAIDEALDGYLTEYLSEISYKAKVGRTVTLPTMRRLPAKAIVVTGLGPRADVGTSEIRRAAGAAVRGLSGRETLASTLHVAAEVPGAVSAAAEGFLLGNYRYTTYKTDPHPSKITQIKLLGADEAEIVRGSAIAEATLVARDLSNEPPNSLTPDALARKANEIADVNGFECTIWDETKLEEKGFRGVLAVAQGAAHPPRFIQLRYAPENATGKVALVGKGVTFDSGGLSLKDAKGMETMKGDMAGAAAVIATMGALTKIDPGIEVLAFIPTTENLPSGDSLKPGDVIRHYNGRTTEVNNTDAEGRLILADALAFACEQSPDAIVDVATLTGGIMVALGLKSAGLFSNDDGLSRELEESSRAAGERLWRMPIYDDYASDLSSEVADTKNSGARWGSAIIGALFLKEHVNQDIPWAHIDIASADWADKPSEEGPKGSTGAATRTLIHWIERRGRGGNGA